MYTRGEGRDDGRDRKEELAGREERREREMYKGDRRFTRGEGGGLGMDMVDGAGGRRVVREILILHFFRGERVCYDHGAHFYLPCAFLSSRPPQALAFPTI